MFSHAPSLPTFRCQAPHRPNAPANSTSTPCLPVAYSLLHFFSQLCRLIPQSAHNGIIDHPEVRFAILREIPSILRMCHPERSAFQRSRGTCFCLSSCVSRRCTSNAGVLARISLAPCSLGPSFPGLCSLFTVPCSLLSCSLAPSLPAFSFPRSLGPCFLPHPPTPHPLPPVFLVLQSLSPDVPKPLLLPHPPIVSAPHPPCRFVKL